MFHPDLPQCKRIQRLTRSKADGLWWGSVAFAGKAIVTTSFPVRKYGKKNAA